MLAVKTRSLALLSALTLATAGAYVGISISAADEPTEDSSKQSSEAESLDVRYARAHLELAKLDLRRARKIAEKFPTVPTARTLESLKRHVDIDHEQLEQVIKSPDGNLHRIHIRSAEIAVDLAESDLQRKRKAYEIMPNEFSALDVERAAAVLKVARLNLERTRAQEASLSTLSYLQWQIEALRNDLLELQITVETGKTR